MVFLSQEFQIAKKYFVMTITAFTNSFTPVTINGEVSSSGVTTAATAFDWFNTASGTVATVYNSMPINTYTGIQNKAFVAMDAQIARSALLPLVKSELFTSKFNSSKTLINNSLTTILNTLSSIQDPSFSSSITSLTPAYTSALTTITSVLNSLKSFENKIYSIGDSIDVSASTGATSIATTYNSTATLASLTNAKYYISSLLDPTTLNGAAIAALTSVNGNSGNASSLSAIFTNVQSSISSLTAGANLQAFVAMSAKNIFDNYAIDIQGYTSSGTSGKYPVGASAPVGIVPGVDFEIHLTGAYQTGVAAAGTAGAPSSVTPFWS